jgi:hypothetical protein
MTAHASRPLVPQIVTTPSAAQLRPADFRSARVSAATRVREEKIKARIANVKSLVSSTPQETCTIAGEGVILDTT